MLLATLTTDLRAAMCYYEYINVCTVITFEDWLSVVNCGHSTRSLRIVSIILRMSAIHRSCYLLVTS